MCNKQWLLVYAVLAWARPAIADNALPSAGASCCGFRRRLASPPSPRPVGTISTAPPDALASTANVVALSSNLTISDDTSSTEAPDREEKNASSISHEPEGVVLDDAGGGSAVLLETHIADDVAHGDEQVQASEAPSLEETLPLESACDNATADSVSPPSPSPLPPTIIAIAPLIKKTTTTTSTTATPAVWSPLQSLRRRVASPSLHESPLPVPSSILKTISNAATTRLGALTSPPANEKSVTSGPSVNDDSTSSSSIVSSVASRLARRGDELLERINNSDASEYRTVLGLPCDPNHHRWCRSRGGATTPTSTVDTASRHATEMTAIGSALKWTQASAIAAARRTGFATTEQVPEGDTEEERDLIAEELRETLRLKVEEADLQDAGTIDSRRKLEEEMKEREEETAQEPKSRDDEANESEDSVVETEDRSSKQAEKRRFGPPQILIPDSTVSFGSSIWNAILQHLTSSKGEQSEDADRVLRGVMVDTPEVELEDEKTNCTLKRRKEEEEEDDETTEDDEDGESDYLYEEAEEGRPLNLRGGKHYIGDIEVTVRVAAYTNDNSTAVYNKKEEEDELETYTTEGERREEAAALSVSIYEGLNEPEVEVIMDTTKIVNTLNARNTSGDVSLEVDITVEATDALGRAGEGEEPCDSSGITIISDMKGPSFERITYREDNASVFDDDDDYRLEEEEDEEDTTLDTDDTDKASLPRTALLLNGNGTTEKAALIFAEDGFASLAGGNVFVIPMQDDGGGAGGGGPVVAAWGKLVKWASSLLTSFIHRDFGRNGDYMEPSALTYTNLSEITLPLLFRQQQQQQQQQQQSDSQGFETLNTPALLSSLQEQGYIVKPLSDGMAQTITDANGRKIMVISIEGTKAGDRVTEGEGSEVVEKTESLIQ